MCVSMCSWKGRLLEGEGFWTRVEVAPGGRKDMSSTLS